MSRCTVIVHGVLIDGTGREPTDDSTVVIRDGRIQCTGKAALADLPKDAEVIDASGKTVMPGLIECHAHVPGSAASVAAEVDFSTVNTLRLSLQRGITTVCSVSANRHGIRFRDAIEKGQLRGCSRLIAGCVVTPTNGHVKYRAADGPWEVRKAVREMAEAGADFIKTSASGGFWGEHEVCSLRNYTLEELEALTDEAHAWHLPVVAHCHTQPGLNNCVAAGVDQIHHGAFIDEEAVYGIRRRGLYYVPTLRVTCERNIVGWEKSRPWMLAEMRDAQPIHRKGVRLAHEIGVKIAVGTDYPGSEHAWRIGDATPWELTELVQCGLTPMEAIVAATKTASEAFRMGKDIGTIEPGKKADLLIVTGNPFDDIGLLCQPGSLSMVLVDGSVEYADDEHKRHYRARDEQPPARRTVGQWSAIEAKDARIGS